MKPIITPEQLRSFVKDWKHSTDVSDLWDYMAGRINAPVLSDLQKRLVSEGWTAWHGGECPVDLDAFVDVHFNDGAQNSLTARYFAEIPPNNWKETGEDYSIIAYRLAQPEKADPYAELKAAHARGEVIEQLCGDDEWRQNIAPIFNLGVHRYRIRIRPWSLISHVEKHFGPMPDGAKFHREDFTREMLPDVDGKPTRPCLLGETGDNMESCPPSIGKWCSASWVSRPGITAEIFHHRTTEPLPVAPRVIPYTLETLPALPFEVREKNSDRRSCVVVAHSQGVRIFGRYADYPDLLASFTHPDGSPLGTKEVQP